MYLLLQFALLGAVWSISARHWRKRLAIPLVLAACFFLALSPLGIQIGLWGLTVGLPPDSGEKVDAIVVLGRGAEFREQRVSIVQELWQTHRAPEVFASGMMDARPIVKQLAKSGIPMQNLDGEECSRSTQENGVFTKEILYSQGKRRIILVTDTAHMLRAWLIFRNLGFEVIPHSVSMRSKLTPRKQILVLIREYSALLRYALTQHQLEKSPYRLSEPTVIPAERIQDWNCRVRKTT